jgi:hypothetical protein
MSFYDFYGYDVEINIGSMIITTALSKGEFGLCDTLTVTRQENTASNATFSFIPPEHTIILESYQGEPVFILVRTPADGWQQIFSGYVDVPSLDFLARKVTLVCTDDRNNQIIQLDYSIVSQVGIYDEIIFGASIDQSDELGKRLQTVTASFDFDRFGNPTLTDWSPKNDADFSFDSGDVQQGTNPKVSYSSAKTTINTVNMTFTYNYSRLHQQAVNFVWSGYNDFINDYWLQGKPSFPTKTMITSATTTGNWKFINPSNTATFVDIWPAGTYYSTSAIVWQPNTVTRTYVGRTEPNGYLKDSTGNFVTIGFPPALVPQTKPVLDAITGKQVMDLASETITHTADALCRGAQWTSALKFAQNVSEVYTVNVVAPQSVAKFGSVNQYAKYSYTDQFDTNPWEQSATTTAIAQNFYINKDINRYALTHALITGYYKAVHDILQVHRDIQITFQTLGLRPQVDLIHTVALDVEDPRSSTAHISTQGKVSALTHMIDFRNETASTNLTLSITRMAGVSFTGPIIFQQPLQDPSYIGTPQNIALPTHTGINPDPNVTPGAELWTGYIGNRDLPPVNAGDTPQRTQFPESFVVDYPAMPDSLRNLVTYTSVTDFTLAIENDLLDTST